MNWFNSNSKYNLVKFDFFKVPKKLMFDKISTENKVDNKLINLVEEILFEGINVSLRDIAAI